MHRFSVVVMGWMTDKQFGDMFALAQMAPGPNVLIVTLMAEQGLAWWFGTPKRGGSRFTLRAARRRLGRLAARVRAQV